MEPALRPRRKEPPAARARPRIALVDPVGSRHSKADRVGLIIEPFDPEMVQPSSVDLRVADEFRVFRNRRYPFIDLRNPMEELTDVVRVKSEEAFVLHPR